MLRKSLAKTIDNMKRVKYIMTITQENFNTRKTATALIPIASQNVKEFIEDKNKSNVSKKSLKCSSFIFTPYSYNGNNLLNGHSSVFKNIHSPNVWNSFKRLVSSDVLLTENLDDEPIFNKVKKRLRVTYPSKHCDDSSKELVKSQNSSDELPKNENPKKGYNQTWNDFPEKNYQKKPLVLTDVQSNEIPKKRMLKTFEYATTTLRGIGKSFEPMKLYNNEQNFTKLSSKLYRELERNKNSKQSWEEPHRNTVDGTKQPTKKICAPAPSFSETRSQDHKEKVITAKTKTRINTY